MTRPLLAIGMRGTARCAEDPWTPGAMGRFHTTSSLECQTARIFELASDQSIRSANLPRPSTRLGPFLLGVLGPALGSAPLLFRSTSRRADRSFSTSYQIALRGC